MVVEVTFSKRDEYENNTLSSMTISKVNDKTVLVEIKKRNGENTGYSEYAIDLEELLYVAKIFQLQD